MNFAELGLSEPIVKAVSAHGYETPTPIQLQAVPAVLSGRDLLAGAQTGTGKTAGFVLPILERLLQTPKAAAQPTAPGQRAPRPAVRVLILTPTRELAAQVEESVKTYGKFLNFRSTTVFGGVSINPQIDRLARGVDILVATPGRLLDHLQQRTVNLSAVEIFVLDEADRMLDMGFIRDIKKVMTALPKKRQSLLFSATFSDEIKELAQGLLTNPGLIEVARRNTTAELITQKVMMVEKVNKRPLLSHLIKQGDWHQVLVFCRTKHGSDKLALALNKDGINSMAIHGNKSQGARTRALAEFKGGELQVLVATDIAARGLDIELLPHVVNFELPNVPEDYVHRIGRTGRAGALGEALSLVSSDERDDLRSIERLIKQTLPRVEPENFVAPPASAEATREANYERPRRDAMPGRSQPRRTQAAGSQPAGGRPSQPAQPGRFGQRTDVQARPPARKASRSR
jgi:ATP-dependent RNA helicase RhlE